MKKYIAILIAFVIIFIIAVPWIFNHIDPWLAVIIGIASITGYSICLNKLIEK